MSEKQIVDQIMEAVEEYHEGKYRDGFAGVDGGKRKREAEGKLVESVDGTYDAYRKSKE